MKTTIECTRCVMNSSSDPDLVLDKTGVCNHCHNFDREFNQLPSGAERDKACAEAVARIKQLGRGNKYDCLLGVSGGVDSSYLAYLCKKFELRPLIIHFDNGWNSDLAVKNIERMLKTLGFELYTYVINWEEFKDIQLSYFKAGVVDLEIPTDHAILASMFHLANKFGIKSVLSGHNVVTEGNKMPVSWRHTKTDSVNLLDIHERFGSVKIKSYPYLSFTKRLYNMYFVKFEWVQLLNLVEYNKAEAKKTLINELGWTDYGGKHYESIFTRFYQAYILPEKFKIDKRQFHLSCLVQSKQISRDEALRELTLPLYDPKMLEEDKLYVIKKLDFSEDSFKEYIAKPRVEHDFYKTDKKQWEKYYQLMVFLSKIKGILLLRFLRKKG